MSMGSILNVQYPQPAHAAGGASVTGQFLTVTSTVTSSFSAFNINTKLVMFDVQTANVYMTVDGTTPSASAGHILYAGANFCFNKGMAAAAKFVATTTTNATIYGSELGV